MDFLATWGEAAKTAVGFFWKAGWAFVFGYAVSGMIQAFVPKARLTRHMGGADAKSVSLATVLNSNGVAFAGIMGFIYSDLMVPPLVAINAKYYGPRVALYISGVMFVSIEITAVTLHLVFAALNITPESRRAVHEVSRFAVDYTFWLNLAMVVLAAVLVWLHRQHVRQHLGGPGEHEEGHRLSFKRAVVYLMILVVAGGLVSWGASAL